MEKKNDAIKFLEDMQSSFKKMKMVIICMTIVTCFSVVASYFYAHNEARNSKEQIYILDQGSILEAKRSSNEAQRDLEVIDHVTRFHEMFFNLAPNITTINQNISRALELSDESAYKYFSDLKESNYFSSIINLNATQQIQVDSVRVDVSIYPYSAETFATLYILRESTISKYTINSSCRVNEVIRTKKNPHGLMITKFFADKAKHIETRNR